MTVRFLRNVWLAGVLGTAHLSCLPAPDGGDSEDTMKTVGGQLSVGGNQFSGDGQYLTLNKKLIKGTHGEVVSLKQHFRMGISDVILVKNGNMGSCCDMFSSLYFLTITPAGKTFADTGEKSVSIDSDEEGSAVVRVDGDKLMITTVTQEGRRKTTHRYIFANGKTAELK